MLRRRPVEVVDDEVDLIDRHLPDHERHAITHTRSSSARYTLVHVGQPNPRSLALGLGVRAEGADARRTSRAGPITVGRAGPARRQKDVALLESFGRATRE